MYFLHVIGKGFSPLQPFVSLFLPLLSWLCRSWFWPGDSTSQALMFIRHPPKSQFNSLTLQKRKKYSHTFFFAISCLLMSRLLKEAQARARQAAGRRGSGEREGLDSTPSGEPELLLSSLQLIIIPEDESVNSMSFYHYSDCFYIALLRLLMQTDWNMGKRRDSAYCKYWWKDTIRVWTNCQLIPLHKSKQDWTCEELESCALEGTVLGRRNRIKSCYVNITSLTCQRNRACCILMPGENNSSLPPLKVVICQVEELMKKIRFVLFTEQDRKSQVFQQEIQITAIWPVWVVKIWRRRKRRQKSSQSANS